MMVSRGLKHVAENKIQFEQYLSVIKYHLLWRRIILTIYVYDTQQDEHCEDKYL
jgi:hypothetical protein